MYSQRASATGTDSRRAAMNLTVRQVVSRFPGWHITDISGGWVAYRVTFVPRGSGLSNVRCGATLEELAGNLQAEIRLQESSSWPFPSCSMAHP
jgi:hypothetical protein